METVALFAYGTLQHPFVLAYILGSSEYPQQAAVLRDHVRYRIKDADYPGIYPQIGQEVEGTVFEGITIEEWAQLDRYESDLYERRRVQVVLQDGSRKEAFAYVLPPAHESVCTKEPWHLTQYIPPVSPE